MKPLKERLLDKLNEYKDVISDRTHFADEYDEMIELLDDLSRAEVVENVRLPANKREIS